MLAHSEQLCGPAAVKGDVMKCMYVTLFAYVHKRPATHLLIPPGRLVVRDNKAGCVEALIPLCPVCMYDQVARCILIF